MRYGDRNEEFGDGLGGEIDGFDLAVDDTEDGFAAEGDEDELAGEKFDLRRVGQNTAAAPEDFSRNYLEKHIYIIAQNGESSGKVGLWGGFVNRYCSTRLRSVSGTMRWMENR